MAFRICSYGARRKFWEINHNDGEIRIAAYIREWEWTDKKGKFKD